MSKTLRIKQVAEKLSVSKATVYRWLKNGTFPKPKKITTGIVVWLEKDIDAWLEEALKNG